VTILQRFVKSRVSSSQWTTYPRSNYEEEAFLNLLKMASALRMMSSRISESANDVTISLYELGITTFAWRQTPGRTTIAQNIFAVGRRPLRTLDGFWRRASPASKPVNPMLRQTYPLALGYAATA